MIGVHMHERHACRERMRLRIPRTAGCAFIRQGEQREKQQGMRRTCGTEIMAAVSR